MVKLKIKNESKYVEKIERAEKLLKELKDIFAWDLSGEIEVEIETATENEPIAEEKIMN